MTTPLNIYQRINEVRKKVHYAQKDKQVQNYKAVTHDQVTALLRNELIDQCILIVPSIVESSVVDSGTQTQQGTPIIRYQARFDIAFVNVDDPADRFVSAVEAHANDTGDKAPGKALSYATKSAMLKVFTIETGESDESRFGGYVDREPIDDEQVAKIEALIAESVKDRAKFIAWLVSAVGTDQIQEIPARKLDLVVKQLETIRDAGKKPAKKTPVGDPTAAQEG